ncbi:MAG: homoserine dehydrogenase, partial [Gammaproteobacteria bacterium]|nr:homoserine dehydrogenase [Gammaproteobacteria bacterium]
MAGLGTVGQSLVYLLRENRVEIERNAGMPIEIVRVVSRTPKPEVDIGDATFSTDINSL